ncbi:hypothetical protein VF14_23405 [Nostoc linckia z18]|uniref:Dynamin family protein n=2 Tax=Nostoc linckia TaxID=92942 RepID=A0A9Q6EIG3_NOSLI|nr:GTPase domain-containing protein [Nostoc linckia]PHK38430.1 hypothetical protein VF12_18155 [Nostoc linckia z15]PHK43419.1 hypothetical protein VF13_27335 [Nostoc linckia z16]PHJ67001.1 hypothetical protein VF02_06750 [Nostoc linckia z1]PHJ67731.1 hypothetical protein VF05_17075 [Nostoc linckia z3]PHJ77263.1 hypothetical protein VF03_05310 [Nostoc linckia z2]
MNLDKTAQIISIIEQRRPLVNKIERVESNLRSLSLALHHLQEHREQLLSKIDEEAVITKLHNLNFSGLQTKIEAELIALNKLKTRFNRNTLNIGVIGRARQGKSRLLQSLTGLTSAEIPDGDRQHCTGVRSTIHHNSNFATYGEVWFHTERSFLDEVIAPYYEKLRLGLKPITLEAFANHPLPPLPVELTEYAEPGAMYQHLRRYHINLDKYRHLLKVTSPRRISQAEIREYVAQDTTDGQRIFFNYLAVQEVKITCKFPHEAVGQIALVDMPGLGDTGIGDEERLVKTLAHDVDAVIFVRMPKSSGDYWADVDVRLYDIAANAITELPINLWSFLILNRTDSTSNNSDNWYNCQDLAQTLSEKHIQVVNHVIANCANPQEANQVLELILDYLAKNITILDSKYAFLCQERLVQLQNTVAVELEKARQVLEQAASGENWFPLFENLFAQLWDNLTTGLEALLKKLREQRDAQNIEFRQQVEAALKTCQQDSGIPTEAEIETRRNRVGGYPNAYYEYLNEVRAYLSQHFLLLDKGLKQGLDRVKGQVSEVLINQAGLGFVSDVRGEEFINAIAAYIPNELIPSQPSRLKLGFQILADFELSYRGMIQHRIRQRLDDLTPDETSLQLSSSPCASEVLSCLQALHSEAIYKCRTALDDLLAEPSQAAFAIVEEFLDRVLRAEGAKTEWRIFLEEVRSEVWCDEFEQLGERTRTRREWIDSIECAATANKLSGMQFLN